jgi:hypothetical protein
MQPVSDLSPLDDAIRSAVGRAHVLGEPSVVLVIAATGADPAQTVEALLSSVRASDVAQNLGDGTFAVVLHGVGRLPGAAVAERLERRAGAAQVGMTVIVPGERRDSDMVLEAVRHDLRARLAGDDVPARLAAA